MSKFSEDAKRKTTSGLKAKELFSTVVNEQIESLNLNVALHENYAIGYEGMEQDQFKADFALEFHENAEKWLISTTSSPRSDRILGDQFKAEHILVLDIAATRYYLVLPSSLLVKDLDTVAAYSSKIHNLRIKSFVTDILTIDDFIKLFVNHAFSITSKSVPAYAVAEKSIVYQSTSGVRSNILGKKAENSIAQTLMNETNIILWNNPERGYEIKSESFREFKAILTEFGYCPEIDIIESIVATTNIPKLIKGGDCKTDVMFTVTTTRASKLYTISVKNTQAKQVTIHEGTVVDLITALGIESNSVLAKALLAFQEVGGPKNLLRKEKGNHYSNVLTEHLPKYKRRIAEFAFFGVHSPRITDDCQIADSILYNTYF